MNTPTILATCSLCHGTGTDVDFGGACSSCHGSARRQAPPLTPAENDLGALADWLAEQTWSEFATSLASYYRGHGYLSAKQESAARAMKAKMDAKAATSTPKAAPSEAVTEAGFYRRTVDGLVFKVQPAKSTGNLYALRMGTGKGWNYEAGAIRTLKASERLDLEGAKAFGRETGRCCSCGAELTNPESIAAGIGPVCGSRF